MTIIELLTMINNQYLVALAVAIASVVEVVKRCDCLEKKWMPLVAIVIGSSFGLFIGLMYGENIVLTVFNGLVVSMLAIGGFDTLKVLWRLPSELS